MGCPATPTACPWPPSLQALLGSSHFCRLLAALRSAAGELDPAACPTLAALAELAAEYPELVASQAQQLSAAAAAAAAHAAAADGDGDGDGDSQQQQHAATPGKPAAKSLQLGGQAFHPHMLSVVVNAFRPQGSGAAPAGNVVLGPGANGGLGLAVSVLPRAPATPRVALRWQLAPCSSLLAMHANE